MRGSIGRPPLLDNQKDIIVQKLEPYLKAGLSVRKACREAEVPKSTVYDLIKKDEEFADKIRRYQQFVSVLLSNTLLRQLMVIAKRQNDSLELSSGDLRFLQWFATHSSQTREEFGDRRDVGLYDPEMEIKRLANLIDSASES